MKYRRPEYYNDFSCVADQCPDTCCAGWQIGIDEDSLEMYSNVKGDFGTRLLNSIDWRTGMFEQYNKRCSFLNDRNLCDLYTELGPDALCDTCKNYPRHMEEFEGVREYSLSLSCPIAAKMILSDKVPMRFVGEEDDLEENYEDYEEFDFMLYEHLEQMRELIFRTVQNREMDIEMRMLAILRFSDAFQKALEEGMMFQFDMEQELEKAIRAGCGAQSGSRRASIKEMWKDLQKLEVLREEWADMVKSLDAIFCSMDEAAYTEARTEFRAFLEAKAEKEESWNLYKEQLLMFYLYTYFCGAVYDDMVCTKTVLAVFGVIWIDELLFAKWLQQGKMLAFADVEEIAYRYAREIEHSDENLNLLEDIFWDNELYQPEALAAVLVESM